MMSLYSLFVILYIFCLFPCINSFLYNESLYFRPLEDGRILVNFAYSMGISNENIQQHNYELFPKSIGQLIYRYGIESLKLSLTSGRFRYHKWGYPHQGFQSKFSQNNNNTVQNQYDSNKFYDFQEKHLNTQKIGTGPNGAELFAELFNQHTYDHTQDTDFLLHRTNQNKTLNNHIEDDDEDDKDSVNSRWRDLQQSLAGTFCASLNQIGIQHTSTPTYFSNKPEKLLNQLNNKKSHNSNTSIRYGTLPRENVCTENLTPWTKLLPCRNQAGISKLMHSLRIFDSLFNSLQVEINAQYNNQNQVISYELIQSLHVVLDPRAIGDRTQVKMRTQPPSWSLHRLFNEKTIQACPVAYNSNIFIHLPPWITKYKFADSVNQIINQVRGEEPDTILDRAYFELSSLPDAIDLSANNEDTLFYYNLHSKTTPFPFSFTYRNLDIVRGPSELNPFGSLFRAEHTHPNLQFQRYFTGSGHRGALHIELANIGSTPLSIIYFDSLQWFIKLYWSSLSIQLITKDNNNNNNSSLSVETFNPTKDLPYFRVLPSIHRNRPSELEFQYTFIPGSQLDIVIQFEKSFLTINNDYPPDVSRGFDVQSGIITIIPTIQNNNNNKKKNNHNNEIIQRIYTNGLLISLPFPDNSMPFNVIAFSSTVLCFFFGSLFNILYSSPVEIMTREKESALQKLKSKILAKFKRKKD